MHKNNTLTDTIHLACNIRRQSLKLVNMVQSSHIGSCLSVTDILAHLYSYFLKYDIKKPDWDERDRFILSKGHAAAALYSTLSEIGFFPKENLKKYCADGSDLYAHISNHVPGVEICTGSLGHGLSFGIGMAIALKRIKNKSRVVVVLSDGECDEGSTWEAVMMAPHLGLDNLLAIVDYNKIQALGRIENVVPLEPFKDKRKAFNWECHEIDGHDHNQIQETLKKSPFKKNRPSVIIANTVKGKGVSYMENKLLWHYRPPDKEHLEIALKEIDDYEKRTI